METETQTATRKALLDCIDRLGLEYTAEFVPKRQPANKVRHPQLHWKITLKRGRATLTTPYTQGCGHVAKSDAGKNLTPYGIRRACETGMLPPERTGRQPAPKLADVLYCLVLDSDVLEHADFESWASDCGYNTDSREAEKTYRACIENALQLRALIGDQTITTLRELFADY